MTWREVPLRALYRRIEESGREDLPLLSVYRDHGVVPRAGRDDNYNKPSDDLSRYKVVCPGDLVLNKMKTWQGSLGVSAHHGIVSPAYFVGRRTGEVNDRFMHHLLRSKPLIAEYGARSKGIRPSQWDLPWDEFAAIKVRLPSPTSQRAIADFLDAETARIDALISKKRRLIELLDERLREVVRSAVTGADASGPRWAAGPFWLSTVPQSWRPQKIAWRKITTSGATPESGNGLYYDEHEGVPWVTTSELREEIIHETRTHVTAEALRAYSALRVAPRGAVTIAMYGATVGRLGILGVPAATNQACCSIFGGTTLDQDFLYWWLWVNREHLVSMGYGAGQPNISQEIIRNLRVPAPSHHEQIAIASRIRADARRAARVTAALDSQTELLVEHRQALITAAVTGEMALPGAAA